MACDDTSRMPWPLIKWPGWQAASSCPHTGRATAPSQLALADIVQAGRCVLHHACRHGAGARTHAFATRTGLREEAATKGASMPGGAGACSQPHPRAHTHLPHILRKVARGGGNPAVQHVAGLGHVHLSSQVLLTVVVLVCGRPFKWCSLLLSLYVAGFP